MDLVLKTKKKRLNIHEEFLEKYLEHVKTRIPRILRPLVENMLNFDSERRLDIIEIWNCLQPLKVNNNLKELDKGRIWNNVIKFYQREMVPIHLKYRRKKFALS